MDAAGLELRRRRQGDCDGARAGGAGMTKDPGAGRCGGNAARAPRRAHRRAIAPGAAGE
jgi:hypothetical protein